MHVQHPRQESVRVVAVAENATGARVDVEMMGVITGLDLVHPVHGRDHLRLDPGIPRGHGRHRLILRNGVRRTGRGEQLGVTQLVELAARCR